MKYIILKLSVVVLLAFSLQACQTGHPYSGSYPQKTAQQVAKNTPAQIPAPRKKPAVPKITKVSGKNVTVQKGDTIYALSRRYGVTVRSLINYNKMRPPYLLKSGQRLKLPRTDTLMVKKGDTLYSLSRKYGVDMAEFVRINGLQSPYRLKVGQKLHISKSPTRIVIAPPPPRSNKGFLWPVRGKVISRFGPYQGGFHNDGINISATSGSPVRAAEAGVVVHADNKLRAFGNLILIKHDNGWITAYAHTSNMYVQKGQRVARGQSIAKVGRTGRVQSPQLHFEMRKGSRAVNPEVYLKS